MAEPPHSNILFLCTGNYYRSRTAEAVFNHEATKAGLPVRASSRGLRLSAGNVGPISPHASVWLAKRGVPFEGRYPLDVSESDLRGAAHVVAVDETEHRTLMQERFPLWEAYVEYWVVHDIDRTAPREALAALDSRVRALLERWGAQTTPFET